MFLIFSNSLNSVLTVLEFLFYQLETAFSNVFPAKFSFRTFRTTTLFALKIGGRWKSVAAVAEPLGLHVAIWL